MGEWLDSIAKLLKNLPSEALCRTKYANKEVLEDDSDTLLELQVL